MKTYLRGGLLIAVHRAGVGAPAAAQSDDWKISIYPVLAWVPTRIGIDVNVPPISGGGGSGPEFGGKIVDGRFDGAFFGGLSAAKGTWRIDADGLWAAVGGDRLERPVLRVDVDAIYGHASVGRKIASDFYATVGVRRMALKYDIELDGREFERKPGLWDPLIGVGWHTRRQHSWICMRRSKAAGSASAPTWTSAPRSASTGNRPRTSASPPATTCSTSSSVTRSPIAPSPPSRRCTARSSASGSISDARRSMLSFARSSFSRCCCAAAPAAAAELPVLFVHGFCSSAETWNETHPAAVDAPLWRRCAAGVRERDRQGGVANVDLAAGTKTFRIDFSDLASGFDLLAVANVPTVRKAGELKVVIDAIKLFTGAPTVILVGHSLGGLAARAYIQGIGRNRNGADDRATAVMSPR